MSATGPGSRLKPFVKSWLPNFPQIYYPMRYLYRRRHMPVCYVLGHRRIARYLKDHLVRKVILGAGPQRLPGWLSTDFYAYNAAAAFLDARKPFPFPDASIDYYFSEHMIEHLSYEDAGRMLGEIFRTLRPHGTLRLATPDLDKIIHLKSSDLTTAERDYVTWSNDSELPKRNLNNRAAFVINRVLNSYGHRFVYDFETLSDLLQSVGFRDVRRFEVGRSDDAALINLEQHGKIVGEQINRSETMAIEAHKI